MRAEHRALMRHALVLLLFAASLVALGVLLSSADRYGPERMQTFALLLNLLFTMIASIMFTLSWRISNTPAYGWLSAAGFFISLHSMPFMLTSFSDPTLPIGSQAMEVPTALVVTTIYFLAWRGTARALYPLVLGLGAALVAVGLRLLTLTTDVVPDRWAEGTAWEERLLAAALTVLAVYFVALNQALTTRVRAGVVAVTVMNGVVAVTNSNFSGPLPDGQALAATGVICCIAVFLLDGAIRSVLQSLEAHQDEMERLARDALRAEAEAHREQELLHEIRSTVGGLATASQLLSRQEELSPAHRTSLQRALSEELSRVNRTVTDTLSEVRSFPLAAVLSPLLDFHRADGRLISCTLPDSDLVVRHAPDSVAQVFGTLLHNAHRHAPGRPLTVSITVHGDNARVLVSQPGPMVDPLIRDRLFERGVRSTQSPGEGIGLSVARRLMHDHNGELALAISSPELTTFVMTVQLGERQ